MDTFPQIQIETVLADLEKISLDLEKGELPFHTALLEYQKGLSLLTQCRAYLKDAENLVKILHEQYHQSAQP